MPIYFLLHHAVSFQQSIRPALTAAWRRRSFEPCRSLCTSLAPAAQTFAERYHTGSDESLLVQIGAGSVAFDRDLWRLLVGEVLLYAAAAVPELQTAPDTLAWLLGGGQERPPIHQAHFGSRDLVLGGYYRPDAAGWNDTADVARLADYLAAIDSSRWSIAHLAGLREFADDQDCADELEFARAVFAPLRELYQQARQVGQVVICEVL
jgi:hypothetical protein